MARRAILNMVRKANEFGVRVPEHTLLSRLGQGGMASVYLAREERLGRLVAIKVIDERFERDERFRRRFEREARTAASLTHPNIVPVYQYGFTSDLRPYLTMAFLDGGSLRDRLHKHGALPVLEALSIARQIAAALLAAHTRNIVHRDLKPDNVLFQEDMPLLTDFGIAKVLDAGTALTAAGANPGTVRYFSPEQASEHAIDQRSDIYSLGVLLYEMLTGHVPIDGDTVVHLMLRIAQQPPKPLPPTLQGLQPLMDLLIAKHPADRLRSCADVVSIIQAMERNWTRFGQLDQLSRGVPLRPAEMVPSDRRTRSDAPTQMFVTPPPALSTPVVPRARLLRFVFAAAASALAALVIYLSVLAPDGAEPIRVLPAGALVDRALPDNVPASSGIAVISRAPSDATHFTSPAAQADAALNVQTYPSGASVTLLGSALPYRPDMQLPMGSVRIQVAKAGHATERRNVLVGPGVNNISVTLRAVTLPAAQSAKLRTPAQG